MQQNYYQIIKKEFKIAINKTPIWFQELSAEGDSENGKIFFESSDEFDEVWGKSVKIELSWEKKSRSEYYHAKEVQKSIDLYNSINVVASKKETIWHLSHELTYWFGEKMKLKRRKYYQSKILHGLFYCEITERFIEINFEVVSEYFPNYEPFLFEMMKSIECH